jgi:signal transduction histidine kinase/ActR/RegA family two-component response regulator
MFYYPAYRLLGVWKLVTGIVSAITAVVLIRLVPRAIELPGLARVNEQLRHEVDQRTAAEAELRQMAMAADQANCAKDAFLANMSHEIRTPMTAILGFADLLSDERQDRDSLEMISTIQRSARHLLTIINDLLDLSKIEAGKLELRTEAVRPRALVEDTLSSLRGKAEARGLALKCEIEPAAPESITTDGTRLRQILVNLVGNAIKFTESGSIRVCVRSEASASAAPLLAIDVIDTGIGIPRDLQDRLFKPFQQIDESATRRHGGTGLGLSICRRLSELLGGSIELESEQGRGSRFTVRVAANLVVASPAVQRPHRTDETTKHKPPQSPLAGRRILVVDDGADNQRLVSLLLRRFGATVETASNGEEGLRLALRSRVHGEPYDLILMDMQMPIRDGFSATRALREEDWTGSIVALTACAMAGDHERCTSAGCDAVIPKPFSAATLLGTLETVCGSAPRETLVAHAH